eukprot:403253_1
MPNSTPPLSQRRDNPSNRIASIDTSPEPEWSTMPDQYISEQIRDLCADKNIPIINIDDTVRQYLLKVMRVSPSDKDRMNNIITDIRQQEGYNQLPILEKTETSEAELTTTPAEYLEILNELTTTPEYLITFFKTGVTSKCWIFDLEKQ